MNRIDTNDSSTVLENKRKSSRLKERKGKINNFIRSSCFSNKSIEINKENDISSSLTGVAYFMAENPHNLYENFVEV